MSSRIPSADDAATVELYALDTGLIECSDYAMFSPTKALERERGATVWLHHDLEAQRSVRTAPSFYR